MKIRRRKPTRPEDAAIEVDKQALCIVHTPDGPGTGFVFLKPTWVVTAKHVAVRRDGSVRPLQAMFQAGRIEAELRFAHPEVDIAVLELKRPGSCQTPFVPGNRFIERIGGLLCVGYSPAISKPETARYSCYVSGVPTCKHYTRTRDELEEIVFEFPAPHGDGGPSGGPVLGNGAAVVGVVIEGFLKGRQPFLRATSIHTLLEYLTFPGWAAKVP